MARNFTATVKEGQEGQPCHIHFEAADEIGIGRRIVVLRLQPGTDIEDAKEIARLLNSKVKEIDAPAV